MTRFWKYLPWILAVAAVVGLVMYIDKYNKAKAANKSLATDAVKTAVNTGIAGGLVMADDMGE